MSPQKHRTEFHGGWPYELWARLVFWVTETEVAQDTSLLP